MPRVPTTTTTTAETNNPNLIHTTSLHFIDSQGRTLLLRGVNLSGASKAPPGHPSYLLKNLWEDAENGEADFRGRPLKLEDGSADVHLARLRGWGFNLLRFPFVWEALEHEGPKKYDFQYMDYIVKVLDKCREYGFRVYMDPHQDTWSRFSGGSGAPYWTLVACGINPRHLTATQSALLHSEYPYAHSPDPSTLPAMIWSTNYGRLLSQTIFTLFFAGRDFAPECVIDDVNIQDWLQDHFIAACGQLAERIKAFEGGKLLDDCVIGWDSFNEPFEGLCEWPDLNFNPTSQGSTLKKGTHPSPAQSLRLGMGQAQTVDNYKFGSLGPQRDGTVTIDPKGLKIWAFAEEIEENEDGTHPKWGWKRDSKWKLGTCVWALHGVWDIETGYILKPDYFKYRPSFSSPGEMVEVEFTVDYWKAHWVKYARRIRATHPLAIIFVQPPVFAPPPPMSEDELQGRCVYSPHYYDGLTLISRHWNWFNADALGLLRGKYRGTLGAVKIGDAAIRKSLREQIGYLLDDVTLLGDGVSGKYPTLIGEIGTPFDMDGKRSYGYSDAGKHLGDYSSQEKALDASLNACDGERACNWTVWTYVGDDHSHQWGDGWNLEDLSLWSLDDLAERHQLVEKPKVVRDEEGLESRDGLLEEEEEGQNKTSQPCRSMQMQLIDPSAATLLDTLGPTAVAGSSTSLSSFSSLPEVPKSNQLHPSQLTLNSKQHPYEGIRGYTTNPYIFLTNGARAYRAFARPWPSIVVGKPVEVEFNISKGVFKLGVIVCREDLPPFEAAPEAEDERRSTEVYLPLVHYAHQGVVDDAMKIWIGEQNREQDGIGTPVVTDSKSVLDVETEPITGKRNEEGDEAPCLIRDTYRPVYPSSPDEAGKEIPLLDVDITISHGHFRVVGQRVLWWYTKDVSRLLVGETLEVKVEMEVKRRGGSLSIVDWRKVGKEQVQVEEKGICERICDEGGPCRIM